MAEKQQPWGKWFWGDWRKDARLRRCGYAARGLWADILSLMGGEGDRFGFLMMEGQALGASDLVGLLGGSEREVAKMLAELEGKRVFSRTGDADLEEDIERILPRDVPTGVIFSRRMLRDKAKADQDRVNGGKGGNPRLNPEATKTVWPVKQGVNPPDKAQKPEARSQNLETSLRSVSQPKASKPRTAHPKTEPEGFSEFYQAYPLHKARPEAAKAYGTALKRATAEALLDGARRYAVERTDEDPKFTKHPATWLNNDCWMDQEVSHETSNAGRRGGAASGARTFIDAGASLINELRAEARFAESGDDNPLAIEAGRPLLPG